MSIQCFHWHDFPCLIYVTSPGFHQVFRVAKVSASLSALRIRPRSCGMTQGSTSPWENTGDILTHGWWFRNPREPVEVGSLSTFTPNIIKYQSIYRLVGRISEPSTVSHGPFFPWVFFCLEGIASKIELYRPVILFRMTWKEWIGWTMKHQLLFIKRS